MADQTIVIVTPVFNDWESLDILRERLDRIASDNALRLRILAVDDGSSKRPHVPANNSASFAQSAEVVRLVCNLGHQRAIAIGLVEASRMPDVDGVIVMDCDGEDRVEDIPRLLAEARSNPATIVVATRAKRSESLSFRAFYLVYKYLFRALVGTRVDFGNYSYIPFKLLGPLIHSAGIWNHLAASICRSRLPFHRLPCVRGKRFAGESKMNFASLLIHGLGAMSVYVDVILVRVVSAISAFVALLMLAILGVIITRFTTGLAVPGWATNAIGLLTILLVQSFIFVFTFVFILLNQRSMKTVIPNMDGPHYIESRVNLDDNLGEQ